jgi:hypothetical protein
MHIVYRIEKYSDKALGTTDGAPSSEWAYDLVYDLLNSKGI